MTFQVQDNRSNTTNQRPLPSSLLSGQTAINYSDASPGLFFGTDTGSLIKAGPTHIGSSPPAPTGYTSLSVGEMWLDTSGINELKVWGGSSWIVVSTSRVSTTVFIPPTTLTGLPSGAVWNNNGTLNIVP